MSPLRFLRKRRILYLLVLCLFVLGCFTALKVLSSSEEERKPKLELSNQPEREETITGRVSALHFEADHDSQHVKDKEIKQDNPIHNELDTKQLVANSLDEEPDSSLPEPNYNIHIFYYAWYGNPSTMEDTYTGITSTYLTGIPTSLNNIRKDIILLQMTSGPIFTPH